MAGLVVWLLKSCARAPGSISYPVSSVSRVPLPVHLHLYIRHALISRVWASQPPDTMDEYDLTLFGDWDNIAPVADRSL